MTNATEAKESDCPALYVRVRVQEIRKNRAYMRVSRFGRGPTAERRQWRLQLNDKVAGFLVVRVGKLLINFNDLG